MYQMKCREKGVLKNTNFYILTFDLCQLPENVSIGWSTCPVREYIPPPRQCFKCQKFGHGSKACRGKEICRNCGQDKHGNQCDRPPNCANCQEAHPASSRECFYYEFEKETLTIQTRNRISYYEAKKIARNNISLPHTSYAAALKRSAQSTITGNQPSVRSKVPILAHLNNLRPLTQSAEHQPKLTDYSRLIVDLQLAKRLPQ